MEHQEIVALIAQGVRPNGTWADLGAGRGNFTFALRDLLGTGATIYAVDRDPHAVAWLQQRIDAVSASQIIVRHADMRQPLNLPLLDGVLIANTLHFVRDQADVLKGDHVLLKPAGQVIVVEYDVSLPLP